MNDQLAPLKTGQTGQEKNQNGKGITNHPCFDPKAAKKFARMHLPVAPRCNISCNYCNRKFSCVNESRPGVTAKVLGVDEAISSVDRMKTLMPHLTTIGIAGPGDALANPDKTFAVMRAIYEKYPEMNLCLSTNGLALPDYAEEIAKYNISHVTVTMNATNPEIASGIYKWVRYKGETFRSTEGAELLLQNQLRGLEMLASYNVMTKVNFIYMPLVNSAEVIRVYRKSRAAGAELFNIMPFIPVEKTPFANQPAPGEAELGLAKIAVQNENGNTKLMEHCNQCRSDACGLLDDPYSEVQAS